MRGTRVPAIVPSDFRPGTEGVGRLGSPCARTSTTTRNRESAPARTELGGHAGSLRMPTAAAARYRRPSARASSLASSPAAHYGSPPRYLGASCDACAPRYPRVRSCRSAEATGTPRLAGASGYEKMPSTCLRLRVDQLLERTWVSSTDQAPANVGLCCGHSTKCGRAAAASIAWPSVTKRRYGAAHRSLSLGAQILERGNG